MFSYFKEKSMRKILCATYLALQSSVSFANDVVLTWSEGENTYTIKSVGKEHDPATVQAYNQICTDFHKADTTAVHHMSEEEHSKFRDQIINTRAEGLKTGENSLLLAYKNDGLIGGSYYITDDEGKMICMSCGGFKLDLDPQELLKVQSQALFVLTSKKYFKNGEKLLATLAEGSANIPLLQYFGFVKSTHSVEPGLPKEGFLSFEKDVGISVAWEIGENKYKLREESFDPAKCEIFNEICFNFHMADKTGTNVLDGIERTQEELIELAKDIISKRTTRLEQGLASLLLLYKGDTIVGGAYYMQEQNDTIVRMATTGFKLDLEKAEMGLAQKMMFDALGAKKYFPQGERLIVSLRNNSAYIPVLQSYGFIDSDYPLMVEFSPKDLRTFERAVA